MNNQAGFTFVEIVITVAILATLAAIVAVATTGTAESSRRQAYKVELKEIQQAVDGFYSRPDIPQLRGQPQLPIIGARRSNLDWYQGDPEDVPRVFRLKTLGNPLGGTRGGNPVWVDDGGGLRTLADNILNDEDATGAQPGWYLQPVQFGGRTYYVDSRDYFIDFDRAIELGMVREPPQMAAPDNCPQGGCQGSYIFYVASDGLVKTLFRDFPTPETTGYQGIFP